MENVFGNRLQSARRMAGLSLQGLADRLDNLVSKQSLNKYEQGLMKPDSEVLIALANSLNVSIDYFYSTPSIKVEFESIDFRKYSSKLSKTEESSVLEKAKDCFERYFELEDILQLNEKYDYFNFDREIKTAEDAEDAAKKLRTEWNLGHDPIPDVVEMLEDKGYKVIDLLVSDAFDGMKANVGDRKIIVLKKSNNANDDVVRKRFTALHELAHHALTFSKVLKHSEEEKLCHVFACAVLYPEEMAKRELHKQRFHFYQKELEIIKERWGISFTAIFHRAHRLGILNDFILRKFHVGYKKRGYHVPNSEPGRYRSKEVPTRMERLVYLGLAKEVLTINEAAYFSGITAWELRGKMKLMV
jgi:Zn-dependent peptidase ImmA (M78 family)/transcriptional regulator with XRE-family HTH domain